MTPAKFNLEKTPLGMQYVIPGTERPARQERRVYSADGDQFVIPGAERISTREHLARLADKPLVARCGQIGLRGTGLFGSRPPTPAIARQ
ncbi:MAG: hypothetical protein HQ483_16795 [Rhodospirillales bacterium]|nr:hypothetical protein [Rhodospirillales bacterium]